jgi:Domain of unknown function (DUF6316)
MFGATISKAGRPSQKKLTLARRVTRHANSDFIRAAVRCGDYESVHFAGSGFCFVNADHPDRPGHGQRHGEAPWRHDRSDRSFIRNGKWFFHTREGIEVGPYEDQEAAELGAASLSTMLDGINDSEITRQFIKEFMLLKK